MFITPLLLVTMATAAPAPPPVDLKTARAGYSGCLRAFTDKSASDKMAADAFKTALPTQCAVEKEAFRVAALADDKKYGIPAKTSQANFEADVADFQAQFTDLFTSMTGG